MSWAFKPFNLQHPCFLKGSAKLKEVAKGSDYYLEVGSSLPPMGVRAVNEASLGDGVTHGSGMCQDLW